MFEPSPFHQEPQKLPRLLPGAPVPVPVSVPIPVGPLFVAGLLVSGVGGFVAAMLVYRLSAGWWGEAAARRVLLFFCLFPGSVVFSMVYSEGMLISFLAGCMLALERRRWLLAGILAALATATGSEALVIVPACAVAAGLELRRRGWRAARAWRALLAPVLAPFGVIAFGAAFLWLRTGTPLASYTAQRDAWGEKTDPLVLVNKAIALPGQISTHLDLNYLSAVANALRS